MTEENLKREDIKEGDRKIDDYLKDVSLIKELLDKNAEKPVLEVFIEKRIHG